MLHENAPAHPAPERDLHGHLPPPALPTWRVLRAAGWRRAPRGRLLAPCGQVLERHDLVAVFPDGSRSQDLREGLLALAAWIADALCDEGADGPRFPNERAAVGAIADLWLATQEPVRGDLLQVTREAVSAGRLEELRNWAEGVAGDGPPEVRRSRVLNALQLTAGEVTTR